MTPDYFWRKMTNLRKKLKKNELTIGSWITLSDPAIAEIMAKAGFDWLTIDMEHSGLSFDHAQQHIRVIDLCGVTPLVRVRQNDPDMIKWFMDAGAHGVLVPLVKSKKDAERAVNAVKYPPLGTRGVGLTRAQKYSLDFESYRKWNQDNSIVIVQLEHINAVENLEEIMSVEGVDGYIIGIYDLSGSLGCPGDFQHPRFIEVMQEIEKKTKRNNYLGGQHVVDPDPDLAQKKIKEGLKFIGFGVDFLFLGGHCRNSLNELKKSLGS